MLVPFREVAFASSMCTSCVRICEIGNRRLAKQYREAILFNWRNSRDRFFSVIKIDSVLMNFDAGNFSIRARHYPSLSSPYDRINHVSRQLSILVCGIAHKFCAN